MLKTSKLFVYSLCVFSTVAALAQNGDCKYSKNENDKFTKKKIMQTKSYELTPMISIGNTLYASAQSIDGEKSLLIDFNTKKSISIKGKPTDDILSNQVRVPAGSKLMILLGDENTVTLDAKEDFSGKTTYTSSTQQGVTAFSKPTTTYELNTTTTVKYLLSDESIQLLTKQSSNSLRMYYIDAENKEQYFDCDFGKKKTNTLSNMIGCVK